MAHPPYTPEIAAEVDAAWEEEIGRRIAEIDSGKATLAPAEEVFTEVCRVLALFA